MKKYTLLLLSLISFSSFAFEPAVANRILELSHYAGAAQSIAEKCTDKQNQILMKKQSEKILKIAHAQGINVQAELQRDAGYEEAKNMIAKDGCESAKIMIYAVSWADSSKDAIEELKPFINDKIYESAFSSDEHASILAQFLLFQRSYGQRNTCKNAQAFKSWKNTSQLYLKRFNNANTKAATTKLYKEANDILKTVSFKDMPQSNIDKFCDIYSRPWVLESSFDVVSKINMKVDNQNVSVQKAKDITMSVLRYIASIQNSENKPQAINDAFQKLDSKNIPQTFENEEISILPTEDPQKFKIAFHVSPKYCTQVHKFLSEQYSVLINWTEINPDNVVELCKSNNPLFTLMVD